MDVTKGNSKDSMDKTYIEAKVSLLRTNLDVNEIVKQFCSGFHSKYFSSVNKILLIYSITYNGN